MFSFHLSTRQRIFSLGCPFFLRDSKGFLKVGKKYLEKKTLDFVNNFLSFQEDAMRFFFSDLGFFSWFTAVLFRGFSRIFEWMSFNFL